MSNGDTRVDVSSEGEYHLRLAIQLALVYPTGDRNVAPGYTHGCTHWLLDGNAIWFAWAAPSTGTQLSPFPAKMGIDSLVAMTLAWLRETAVYGGEPDIDGDCSRGWRLVSHFSLMPDIRERPYLSFGVRPVWMEYHK